MKAELAVEKISRDYRKYARQMAITKNKMDRAQARYDGRQEGLAEGQAKTQLEIARKMKKMGMPVSQIAEVTGLSLETVERL
jgi:predicted transposase/invertase (TIGR01784 family)